MKLRPLMAVLALALCLSCNAQDQPSETPLTPDEDYLVESYVRVRRAEAMFPHQRALADSLLDRLAGEIDTVRVARAIAALNTRPERWTTVFEAIEQRLAAPANPPSESTRG